ncbi:MAG: chemotaxis protein CheD [Desulfamplus sp.]|nr:chemotaxis protein CheD [Desulfamplus sp.]
MKILGIGDLGATNTPNDGLRTFALGSCVAVIILYPRTRTVGMVHIALPDSAIDSSNRAQTQPGYFADTAIPALFRKMQIFGTEQEIKKIGLIVKIAGGANVMVPDETFKIGMRNIQAVKNILKSYGLRPIAEDVGGNISRTVTVHVNTGEVVLTSPAKGRWNI